MASARCAPEGAGARDRGRRAGDARGDRGAHRRRVRVRALVAVPNGAVRRGDGAMKFREAIRDATLQALEQDPSVFLIGVGITESRAVWGTLAGALERYGPDRVVEGPLAENALTGMC